MFLLYKIHVFPIQKTCSTHSKYRFFLFKLPVFPCQIHVFQFKIPVCPTQKKCFSNSKHLFLKLEIRVFPIQNTCFSHSKYLCFPFRIPVFLIKNTYFFLESINRGGHSIQRRTLCTEVVSRACRGPWARVYKPCIQFLVYRSRLGLRRAPTTQDNNPKIHTCEHSHSVQ